MTIYTDGSVEGSVNNGGSVAVAFMNSNKIVRMKVVGQWSSSYIVEIGALDLACDVVSELKPQSVCMVTDSQALIRSLENGSSSTVTELEEVKKKLLDISSECRVIIQWMPAHVGTDGNKEANKEANVAHTEDQSRVKIGYEAAKKKIRREVNWQWHANDRTEKIYRRGIKQGATDHLEEVLNAQVWSGHCLRKKYYHKRFGEAEDGLCEECWRGRRP